MSTTDDSIIDLSTQVQTPPTYALLKASADQLRMLTLKVLGKSSYGVLELSQILDFKQSGMSHHLKIMATAGLVTARREANVIFYQRAHSALIPSLEPLHKVIMETMDRIVLDAEMEQRIEEVHAARVQNSERLFSDLSNEFREQQELISPFEFYSKQTLQILDQIDNHTQASVLDLGTGEGLFLPELSKRYKNVYALDNSNTMLDSARELVAHHSIDNIEFVHGDTSHPWLYELNPEVIILNMVLHHIPSPGNLFYELAKIINDGGHLIITDLCDHNHRSAKEACGDIWLGFEPALLTGWAEAAGFTEGQSLYASQRNGFKVQAREFIKH